MADHLRLYYGLSVDSSYKTFPVTEETTAAELLSRANRNLEDSDLRLFLVTLEDNHDRMLQDFERPLLILQRTSRAPFRILLKKPVRKQTHVDENLAVKSVLQGARVLREGPMKKLGKGTFADRYFLLDEKHFYYARTAKLVHQEFTLIRLDTAVTRPSEEFGKYSFELQTPHRTYVLKCNNSEDRQKWFTAVQRQCFIVKENQLFDNLAKKIIQEERRRSEVELAQLISCLEFKGLVNFRLGRELIYKFLPASPKIDILFDIENFKGQKNEEIANEQARSEV
jgi:hypothetical protein